MNFGETRIVPGVSSLGSYAGSSPLVGGKKSCFCNSEVAKYNFHRLKNELEENYFPLLNVLRQGGVSVVVSINARVFSKVVIQLWTVDYTTYIEGLILVFYMCW